MALNTVINTNVMALTAHRNLGAVGNRQSKANQKLSSGKKINSAADDAAGLAISDKMKAQIRGLDMAVKNAEDGTSLIQTTEGAMSEITNMMQRIRELTIQGTNGTNTQEDRDKLREEVDKLYDEITATASRTQFNKQNLLTGKLSEGIKLAIGANGGQTVVVSLQSANMNAQSLFSLEKDKFLTSMSNAWSAGSNDSILSNIDTALGKVAKQRAKLGAYQNTLDYTINNLKNSRENLSAANARIEDTDMAKEMMELTQANVLQQAATSMLAQANQAPNSITQLLG